jgi:hypothetical protein
MPAMLRQTTAVLLVTMTAVMLAVGSSTPSRAASSCTAYSTWRSAQTFLGAANRGDRVALERLIAKNGRFKSFSVDDPRPLLAFGTDDQANLVAYLSSKRQTLTMYDFAFTGVTGEYANFGFRLWRSVDGFRHRAYEGKAAMVCATGRLGLLAMGYVGAKGR